MENNSMSMQPHRRVISPLPEEPVVAMAYVPFQNPATIYSAEQGLQRGTLFPCLDKPFCGCEVLNK